MIWCLSLCEKFLDHSVHENIKVTLQNKSVKIFPGPYIVLLITTDLFNLNTTIRYKKITCWMFMTSNYTLQPFNTKKNHWNRFKLVTWELLKILNIKFLQWPSFSAVHYYTFPGQNHEQKLKSDHHTTHSLNINHVSELFSFIKPGLFKFWQGGKFTYIHLIKIHICLI